MSAFAFVLLCVQACLIQNAMSACFGAGPAYGYGGVAPYAGCGAGYGAPFAAPFAAPYGDFGYAGFDYGLAPCGAPYGGAGAGNVAVAGELPVGGATAVAGQVPIIGAVEYGGVVPAAGTVTISGGCACACGGAYY